jgi:hypothetical protein
LQLVKLKGATMNKINYNLETMVVDVVFCDVLSQQEMYFTLTKLSTSYLKCIHVELGTDGKEVSNMFLVKI